MKPATLGTTLHDSPSQRVVNGATSDLLGYYLRFLVLALFTIATVAGYVRATGGQSRRRLMSY